MKKKSLIFFPILLFFISEMNGQIGTYCSDGDFTKICYEFKKDNRFEFSESMCVGIIEGQGRFEIENNKIRFFYEPIDFFENQFTIKKIVTTQVANQSQKKD